MRKFKVLFIGIDGDLNNCDPILAAQINKLIKNEELEIVAMLKPVSILSDDAKSIYKSINPDYVIFTRDVLISKELGLPIFVKKIGAMLNKYIFLCGITMLPFDKVGIQAAKNGIVRYTFDQSTLATDLLTCIQRRNSLLDDIKEEKKTPKEIFA